MKRTHSHDESTPDYNESIEHFSKAPQIKVRGAEVIGGPGQAEKANQAVRRDGRHSTSRDQGVERDLARQNSAEDGCPEDIHDGDSVPRLALMIDLANPMRKREDAIARHSEYESGSGHDGNTGVLEKGVSCQHDNMDRAS